MELLFCTTNSNKFTIAKLAGQKHGVKIIQHTVEVDEIQAEDPKYILEHKAHAIYEKVRSPLVVTDDSRSIPALHGFPGPYAKSVNHWFTAQDWLNLMKGHTDMTTFFEKRLAYIDESGITVFEQIIEQKFLHNLANDEKAGILDVITYPGENQSIAELMVNNPEHILSKDTIWQEFFDWYKKKYG
jgi:XTP/dITP diphosphohydrolase